MRWPQFLTIPRKPDFVIGGEASPYLRRWHVIPRNRFMNIYLHQFLRDDDDRALHTHPYAWNCSILLRGRYDEHLPTGVKSRRAPGFVFRWGEAAHRVVLPEGRPCWTLFITGPRVREWFFLCPKGRVHWRDFVSPTDKGSIGRGCDD